MLSTAMDWPLSREEKKSQLLRLYNDDVQAADSMVESGNKALEALREELEAVRAAAGIHQKPRRLPDAGPLSPCGGTPDKIHKDEVARLRQAVESAAAVLRAILPPDEDESDVERGPSRCRARSEGAVRAPAAVALRPALCRTPRQAGRPKRKVSFGGQPEEEPTHDPELGKEVDGNDTKVILQTPPVRKGSSFSDSTPSSEATSRSPSPMKLRSDKKSRAVTSPTRRKEVKKGSSLKLHLTWLVCSVGLVGLGGLLAFQMGANQAVTRSSSTATPGDKACWSSGFTPQRCCSKKMGDQGDLGCWDQEFTYGRCCVAKKEL